MKMESAVECQRSGATMNKLCVLALGCLLVVAGCASPRHHAADASKPPVVPGQVTAGPDLSGVQLPNFVMPLISGGVSVPKKELTPARSRPRTPRRSATGPRPRMRR